MNSGVYRARLTGKFDEKTARFVSSVMEDERIFEEDIDGTEAHNIMLYEQGIITRPNLKKILSALEKLRAEKKSGKLEITPNFEDVHEFLEAYVIEKVGVEVGGKLHTGRSRNDQVAVDIRMRVRSELNDVSKSALDLVEALLKGAESYADALMVLYTHTQHAQIGVFSHYFLAYTDSLLRDLERLQECFERVNLSPLGAGPIGGSSLKINRSRTASLLGFDGILENSIDAVSSRDFALEAACTLATLMSGLSRIAEDFIIWSSAEFGYLELADEYASTSSVMPQKKNPCTLELIRGRTGQVYGALTNLLTMVKGLPTGYNRDLQETKPPLWAIFDAVKGSLEVLKGVIATLRVNKGRMWEVASKSFVVAVDLAERLVEESVLSFREAHRLVGSLVKEALDRGIKPADLTPEMLEELSEKVLKKKITVSKKLTASVVDVWSCVSKRKTLGSPAPKEIDRMLKARRKKLSYHRARLASRVEALEKSREGLMEMVKMHISEKSRRG